MINKGLELGKINTSNNTVEVINQIKFNCESLAECCSKLIIPVTPFDIERILNQGYEMDQIVSDLSPVLLLSKTLSRDSEKVYSIKRKPFDNTCTFLMGSRCEIHDFKPFVCRIYPFALDVNDDNSVRVIIHPSKLCNAIKQSENNNTKEILLNLMNYIIEEMRYREDNTYLSD